MAKFQLESREVGRGIPLFARWADVCMDLCTDPT